MRHNLVCYLQGGVAVSISIPSLASMLPTADFLFVSQSDDTPAIPFVQQPIIHSLIINLASLSNLSTQSFPV
jgi:hypothetical protein